MKNFKIVCAAALLGLTSVGSVAQLSLGQLPGGPSLLALPLGGSIAGLLADPAGKLISLDSLATVPADITGLVGSGSIFLPGLLAYGAQLDPVSTLSGVLSIGSNTGLGALTGTVPVVGVLIEDPASLLGFLSGNGILSGAGLFGTLPAIPLVTDGLGLGGGALPGL